MVDLVMNSSSELPPTPMRPTIVRSRRMGKEAPVRGTSRVVAVFVGWSCLWSAACSDDPPALETRDKEVCLMRRDGVSYCIEVYEASRKDATDQTSGQDITSSPRSLE